jgi:hypothetical protein
MLVRTKENYDYSTYDDRALTHDGCIVDVGCAGWDMFASLVGKKRIIGVDPFEEFKEGFEFHQSVLGASNGTAWIEDDGDESSIYKWGSGNRTVGMSSWKSFCGVHNVDKISILKLNIEGAEYPLLHSMDTDDFAKIDQIMVSFHDWINPKWEPLTHAATHLLTLNGFELVHIASQYGWRLFVKR